VHVADRVSESHQPRAPAGRSAPQFTQVAGYRSLSRRSATDRCLGVINADSSNHGVVIDTAARGLKSASCRSSSFPGERPERSSPRERTSHWRRDSPSRTPTSRAWASSASAERLLVNRRTSRCFSGQREFDTRDRGDVTLATIVTTAPCRVTFTCRPHPWSGSSFARVTLGVTSVWTMGRDGSTRPLSRTREA
jgi:hypothetical protein